MDNKTRYPSFSGIMTFLRSPCIELDEASCGEYVAVGAPFDATTGSRPGSRYAPNDIRAHTAHFLYHLAAIDGEVIDVVTKKRMKAARIGKISDAGDLRVYPSDVEKTTESIADGIARITEKGAIPVLMGGDHYVTYPAVLGFERGLRKKLGRAPKIGYIHVDSHLDAYDVNDTWGRYYHGSPARRISELEGVSLTNMVWVGVNGATGIEPYRYVTEGGGAILTIADIGRRGAAAVTREAVGIAGRNCDAIYVTLDIDVVDQAYSCGTGSYVYGGISAAQFLEITQVLSTEPKILGIDLTEVSPPLDPTGNTSRLAASALVGFLKPRLFEMPE